MTLRALARPTTAPSWSSSTRSSAITSSRLPGSGPSSGQPDDELRGRAADRLAAAGRRILRHGYDRTARTLLERAVELRRPLTPDIRLELDYAEQLHWADAAGAAGVAAEAQQRARSYGDALGEALARVAEKHFQVFSEQ